MSSSSGPPPLIPTMVDPREVRWESPSATYWVFRTSGSTESVWQCPDTTLQQVRAWCHEHNWPDAGATRIALRVDSATQGTGLIWLDEEPETR